MFGVTGSQLMGAGFSAGQATALTAPSVTTAISAAGTTLATATALSTSINYVSTAAASSGVKLPAGYNTNDSLIVYNDGSGNSFYVYPDASANKINNLTAGAGVLLANNTSCIFTKVTTTRWVAVLSA